MNHRTGIEGNWLYHENCMEFMSSIPDKFYDLAICDIQYGIDEGGRKNKSRGGLVKAKDYKDYGDKETMPAEYFSELFRVSKNQILWGANHFIDKFSLSSPCWIVWDKINGNNDQADCELAWTSFNSAVRIFRFMWAGMRQGKSILEGSTMQGNKKKNEKRIHPNQKPIALYSWILQEYANKGFKLLDTHSGSGSLRHSAYDLGFKLDSCEKDNHYASENENWFQSHIKQKSLFSSEDIQNSIYQQKDMFE